MDLSLKKNYHNKQNEENNYQIVFPSRTTSDSFAKNNTPRIIATRKTKQICPFSYLFKPVDPPQFSSHNNHGIRFKVIECALETVKRRLTDQISENTHDANISKCSIDKYTPVNYGISIKNNQVSIPNGSNIQYTPKTIPSITIKKNRAKKKCVSSASTSQLTSKNIAMYEKSVQIFTFSNISRPLISTSNTNYNGFPQTSNSTSKQYFSSFAKYTRTKFGTGLMPNPRHFENRKETKIDYHHIYDSPFSSFKFTNEAENYCLTYQEPPELKQPRLFSGLFCSKKKSTSPVDQQNAAAAMANGGGSSSSVGRERSHNDYNIVYMQNGVVEVTTRKMKENRLYIGDVDVIRKN